MQYPTSISRKLRWSFFFWCLLRFHDIRRISILRTFFHGYLAWQNMIFFNPLSTTVLFIVLQNHDVWKIYDLKKIPQQPKKMKLPIFIMDFWLNHWFMQNYHIKFLNDRKLGILVCIAGFHVLAFFKTMQYSSSYQVYFLEIKSFFPCTFRWSPGHFFNGL